MTRPRFCKKCGRGDCGDGILRRSGAWDDEYLRKTIENEKEFGKMTELKPCRECEKEMNKRGNFIRKRGK